MLNLNFHGIGVPRGREFGEGERDYWVTPELFEHVLDAVVGRDDVSLSFDDGNPSDLEVALPALLARGLIATFFIVPSWLGTPGFIAADDVVALTRAGMTIGHHGLEHRVWPELTSGELEREVDEGRRALERLTDAEIATLAFPFGAYDEHVLAWLRSRDYEHAYTSDGGAADPAAWLQPREHLRAGDSPHELARRLGL